MSNLLQRVLPESVRLLRIEIPEYHRWGLYLQAAMAVLTYAYWYLFEPVPGIAVAFLGVIAVVMTVRADTFKLAERVVWVVLGAILMCMEFTAIYKDRAAHDKEQTLLRANEQKHFEEVVGNLRDAIARDQTHFDSTIGRVNDVINTETGGDTFYYVDFHATSSWSMLDDKPIPPDGVLLSLVKIGRFPLRDVSVTITDQRKFRLLTEKYAKNALQSSKLPAEKTSEAMLQAEQQSSTTFTIGDLAVPELFLGGIEMIDGDVQRFDVNLRSFKSQPYRLEMVELRRVKNHWSRALWVELDSKKHPWTLIDRDFPRHADGRPDVDWPTSVPKSF